MDPLVTGALFAQRALALGLGSAIGIGASLALLVLPRVWLVGPLGLGLASAVLASLGFRLYRRFGNLDPQKSVRREIEIGLHLVPLVYAGIEQLPGQLAGPYHALAYVMMMSVAAFLSTPAALLTLLSALALEFGLGQLHPHAGSRIALETSLVHGALLVAFAALNWVVFRGEIRRIRRLSKQRIELELQRVKQAARDYRLTGVPRSAADGALSGVSAPRGDEERLLRSSLDHLQESLQLALLLLRKSVSARTAALLWLQDDGRHLSVREVSSDLDELPNGPFNAKEGLFAAALSTGRSLTLTAERAAGRVPLLPRGVPSGALTAVPLSEHGRVVGLLLVESHPGAVLTEGSQRLLDAAAGFVLRSVESERLFVELERAKTEQGKLYQAADMLAAARSEVAVIRAGVESARQFAAFDFAAVTLYHRASGNHEICAVSGADADRLVGQVFRDDQGLVSMVVKNQHALPYRGEYRPTHHLVFGADLPMPAMPSLIILPLVVHDSALGTLILGSDTAGAFDESVRPTLEVLARHVAVSLANARMMKRLEDLATTDGLTGLLNKRALIEVARQKIRAAQRFSRSLSVIVGDIDFFKRVNDEHGHDVGDKVIRGFADVLRRSKRETDSVGRFGGEEFVIVCEETDAEGARLLAERVRSELAAVTFHTPQGPLRVTCSLGVATLPSAGTDWESLFKATDEALYASKRNGRDRVTSWAPSLRGAAA